MVRIKQILIFLAAASTFVAGCQKDERSSVQTKKAMADVASALARADAASLCDPIPQDLKVPDGNKLQMLTYASGVQIYQVRRNASDTSIFEWVNVAPSATLYLQPDFSVTAGVHYAGPTWAFIKGPFSDEKVVGTKLKAIAVNGGAIPWLLLKAVDSLSSPGNKITFIQRVCTTGGLAPSSPAAKSNLGEIDSIPYTAKYLFYVKD